MCGVCIHLGYSSIESIVESVHSAGVHNTQAPDVEFALAVHIHPYPGHVASVWIYIASLIKKD